MDILCTIITDERIVKYFETDIHADHVISVLEKYYQAKIVPENTLIIFDEIQMCERALTSLKYFSEEAPESCFPDAYVIQLDTPIWNVRTNRFYRKCGYRQTGKDIESVYYEKCKNGGYSL